MVAYKSEDLTEIVKDYFAFRGLVWPDDRAAAVFLVTEVGELINAMTKRDPNWVRNNPTQEDLVPGEIGDVVMMFTVVMDILGEPFTIRPTALVGRFEVLPRKHEQRMILLWLNGLVSELAATLEMDAPIPPEQLTQIDQLIGALWVAFDMDPVRCLLDKMLSKGFNMGARANV